MNIFFLPNSRKVLPPFRTFRPDGVLNAQMGSLCAHLQVQARLAVRHAVTVSLHAVKLLYTATFQWGPQGCNPLLCVKKSIISAFWSGGRLPPHGNLQVEPSQHVVRQRKKSGKEWT